MVVFGDMQHDQSLLVRKSIMMLALVFRIQISALSIDALPTKLDNKSTLLVGKTIMLPQKITKERDGNLHQCRRASHCLMSAEVGEFQPTHFYPNNQAFYPSIIDGWQFCRR